MLLARFKISGHSMEPFLKNGESILVSFLPYLFSRPKISDVIVFKFNNKILIKRIKEINKNEVLTAGDNISDSLSIAPIKRKDIIGKMLTKI